MTQNKNQSSKEETDLLMELSDLELSCVIGGTDVLNLVNVKRVPVSVLSSGNTSADNIQVSSVNGMTRVGIYVDEANRPYEEDAVEALLGIVLGHDYEE